MKMARKRKSSSPEERVTRSKTLKFVSRCQPCHNAPPSIENRKMSTPVKKKVRELDPDAPSPRRYSPRFKCQKETPSKENTSAGHVQIMELQKCSSPVQHPIQEEEDTELGLIITLDEEQCAERGGGRRKSADKAKRGMVDDEEERLELSDEEACQEGQAEVDLCRRLDRALEKKSRRHNLTNANVRSILHEVITNEQVVAMMKAAIRETQDMPLFEPKMTRARLKEVVEKGVAIPTWNISPIKKASEVKPPQFVDIPLEEEDSSDEEYCPDEDEEDETGEETFLESDVDSTASSPRGSRLGARPRTPMDSSECDEVRSGSPRQGSRQSRHLRVEAVPMGPPPPPQPAGPPRPPRAPPECSFMEKLNAVEEELDSSLVSIEPYQMSGGGAGQNSLMACRTRSKRPLRDVPLGRLEAELRAPDITPDMYDCSSAPEDREWTHWLQSLMTSDGENEEEGDDEDDPEYNFLDDIDEPDLEDYRNDRAVRITKKEVNELMEELFETFQDEMGVQEQDDEGQEEEERAEKMGPQAPKFNVPQAIRFEEPLANMLTECHRAVKVQLEALQQRRALMESQAKTSQNAPGPQMLLVPPPCALILTPSQKLQLQQQMQQHIQLLTQVHMLSSPVEALQNEASTSLHFLSELQSFAQRGEEARAALEPHFTSIFRACNLQGALSLLEELKQSPASATPAKPTRSLRPYPVLPSKLAWLMATRPVFLYPELLPQCSLDPALKPQSSKTGYTKGEDCLIVLGLKHFGETELPYQLICRYLIRTKTHEQVRKRVREMRRRRDQDNVFKLYVQQKIVPPMPLACGRVMPGEERPPVEREESVMPNWLRKSLPYIHRAVKQYNGEQWQDPPETTPSAPHYTFPPGTRYPPMLPKNVTLRLHPARYISLPPLAAPKPGSLRGYKTPSFPSLAKAPGNTPSQGVLLLAKAPFTPIQGALSLAAAPLTPAHGAVPLNAAYSVPLTPLSAGFGQEMGCSVLPPQNTPAVLQVPSVSSLSGTLFSPGGVTACIMQTAQVQAEAPSQRARPRKLLPIQPAPPRPAPTDLLQLHGFPTLPAGGGAEAGTGVAAAGATSGAGGKNRAGKRSPPPMTPSPIGASEGVARPPAEPPAPPQDPVTHPSGPLARLRRMVRPLLPAPPHPAPPQSFSPAPADGGVKLRSSPLFNSHSPPPPPPLKDALESGTSPGPLVITLGSEEMTGYLAVQPGTDEAGSVAGPQALSDVSHFAGVAQSSSSLERTTASPCTTYAETVTLPLVVDQNPPFLSAEAGAVTQDQTGASQYILVQTTAEGAAQFLLLPQNCLITPVVTSLATADVIAVAGDICVSQIGVSWEPETHSGEALPDAAVGTDRNERESAQPRMESSGAEDTTPPLGPGPPASPGEETAHERSRDGLVSTMDSGGGPTEEEEADGGEGEESGEEEGGDFGGALLALSESSGSPASSLESCVDALEGVAGTKVEMGEDTTPRSSTGEGEGAGDMERGGGGPEGWDRDGDRDGDGESRVTCVRLSVTKPAWAAVVLSRGSEGQKRSGEGGGKEDKEEGERREGGGGGEGREGGREGRQNGKGEDEGEKEGDGEGKRSGERGGDGKREGEKDGDGERERQGGEEEEEEDFDDLTQDEDEEEVMSSASEESVLSVPELQETMEKLTWLASEGRLCGEGDSEEDNSPNSPTSPTSPTSPVSQNSQEENSEEEEEGPPKGEESESGEGGAGKLPGGEAPQGAGPHQTSGRGAGRGRGRGRPPPRSLKRSRRQERDSKDASKLPLLYDDRILDNDPLRESKDIAFAQAYLNRVREALQDVPGKVEEFLGLLYEFERGEGGEGRSAVELFSQLRPVLRDWPDLLRDFAAFLLPEQALECGLFAEQQAFERSRRFLRQLEISFGENPSHYQKIVRALQGGPGLSDAAIDELKAQMASLLKGHTHLQGEFWVFFDELRPPPSRPGQFEEAAWPEEGGGVTDSGDGAGAGPVGGASGGFEEVTLPDLEEEEEVHKIPPITARSRRRKELSRHSNDKECDWSEKDCSCPCHDTANDAKLRRHKRKGCCRCHTNKVSESSRGVKGRDASYAGSNSLPQDSQAGRRVEEREEEREGEKEVETEVKDEGISDANSPHPADTEPQPWDGPEGRPAPVSEEREEEEEEEEWKEAEREGSPSPKKSRRDGDGDGATVRDGPPAPPSGESEASPASVQPRPSPGADPPVCAKNISLTPSGEKVILWTREADRVILTACQQQGANQSTFQAVSAQLGNKTATEVSRRFRDLVRLFHTAARQASSEDEASNAEQQSATDEELD